MIISDQRLPVENPCLELEWSQQLLGYLQLISKVLISPIFWLVSVNFLAMTMNLLLSHVRNHIYSLLFRVKISWRIYAANCKIPTGKIADGIYLMSPLTILKAIFSRILTWILKDFCSKKFKHFDIDKKTIYTTIFFRILESADREPVECCEDGEFRPLTSKSEFERMICIPIEVPRSDILPTRCINLVRSIAVNNLECSGGPIEQLNQISHWFDASNIYGSVPSVQAQVCDLIF